MTPTEPAAQTSTRLEQSAFLALALGLGLIQFSIKAEWILIIAGLLWIALAVREGRRPDAPAFLLPLLVLAVLTLVSAAFSMDPVESFKRSRQLSLLLIVPGTARLARGPRAMTIINIVIALGAIGAVAGIVEFTMLGFNDGNHRPPGTLGHYMTYSGLIMLVTCAAAARLLYYTKELVWPAIAVPALLVALALTQSRNAWVGTVVAISVLLAMRSKRLLIAVPALALLFALLAPAAIKNRALSIFDPNDPASRDRFAMLASGVAMVRDHPLFGVGPNMVPVAFPQYRTKNAVDAADAVGPQTRSHLHNVPMQIAAERGLPALAAWLWFVVVAGRDLLKQARRGPARVVACAGLAALIGMFFAGLFEHNFGDSEFLVLFLGLITLPFAAGRDPNGGLVRATGPS